MVVVGDGGTGKCGCRVTDDLTDPCQSVTLRSDGYANSSLYDSHGREVHILNNHRENVCRWFREWLYHCFPLTVVEHTI